MRTRSVALVVALASLLAACGYLSAGQWDDDPANWRRAFRSEPSPGATVAHSRYRRSAHWSYEFQYFFELQPTPEFTREFFARNALVQLPQSEVPEAIRDPFCDPPPWFCPKPPASYDAWVYRDEPRGNLRVLLDRQTGFMFLTDFQM